MMDFPSIGIIETLFNEMEPELNAKDEFTPSSHQESLSLIDEESSPETEIEIEGISQSALGEFVPFVGSDIPLTLGAVDVGVMDLGLTRTGFVLAFKGAVVTQALGGLHQVSKIGPRVKFITPENRTEILRYIGAELGQEEMFVERQGDGSLSIKAGAREPNQYKDRIRNFVERMLQLDLIRTIRNGLVLIDGTLTLRTYNTPQVFLERLGREAKNRNSDIVGVSKKSRVTVHGTHLGALLDEDGVQPGFREILAVDTEGSDSAVGTRNLGNLYAARFGPGGFTFRVDVAKKSIIPDEPSILQALYANTQMTLGYPNLLRLAHIHAAFTKAEIVSLQVQAAHDHKMPMRAPEDFSVVFSPFRKGLGG